MIQNDKSKKIIIALDYDNKESVINLCDQLDPSFCRVKIGKQLFTKLGPSIIDIIHNHIPLQHLLLIQFFLQDELLLRNMK